MRKILPIFLSLLLPFCLSINGYSTIKQKQNSITSCSIVKPLSKYVTVYSGLEQYTVSSIIAKSDLIIKCRIIDEKEVCITKKQANKIVKKLYKQLYTIKVLNVLKADKTNMSITENKDLKIFSESCSHNWHDGTIKIKNNQNVILFLNKSKPDISKYGEYVINAPDWSVVIENQNKYTYDKLLLSIPNICESSSKRIGYGGGVITQYVSSKFEDSLLDQIISNIIEKTIVPKTVINKPIDFNKIEVDKIRLIKIVWRDRYKFLANSNDKNHFIQIMKSLTEVEPNPSPHYSYYSDFYMIYIYYNNHDYERFTIIENSIIHVKLDKNQTFIAMGTYNFNDNINDKLQALI